MKQILRLFFRYETLIKDYNIGTLIRPNASESLSEHNSMLGSDSSHFPQDPSILSHLRTLSLLYFLGHRMQFYAIEIARNREGLNDVFVKSLHAQL